MRFSEHHLETNSFKFRANSTPARISEHKINVWNALIDTNLSEITEDDCAIFPRMLPGTYLKTIQRTALEICTFAFRLLSLPKNEAAAIFPRGPIRDFLINELEVLKYRNDRIIGSMRLDLAIVGEPTSHNPPKLLEINEIGFDGLSRSSVLQRALVSLLPELRSKAFGLDTTTTELMNMRRMGKSLVRFQEDSYNWDEEHFYRSAINNNFDLRLVCPKQFHLKVDEEDFPLMHEEKMHFKSSRLLTSSGFRPDAYQMSFALDLKDYQKSQSFFQSLVRSKTTGYGPFLTGLIASKMILVLINDPQLRRRFGLSTQFLKSCVLPAEPLANELAEVRAHSDQFVLKHVDGFGGQMVFLDEELKKRLKRIPHNRMQEWVVQQRTQLNLLKVNGINSRPRKVISDLGVFVHYDWSKNRFQNFKVGGFISRATNRSYKVNVSGGGIQLPVMFIKGK